MSTHIYQCMSIYIQHTYIQTRQQKGIHACRCTYTRTRARAHAHMHMYTYLHTCTCTRICLSLSLSLSLHICIYKNMCIYTEKERKREINGNTYMLTVIHNTLTNTHAHTPCPLPLLLSFFRALFGSRDVPQKHTKRRCTHTWTHVRSPS